MDTLLTTKEAAALLRKSEDRIRELCRLRKLPHFKVGNTYLFDRDKLLASCEVQAQRSLRRVI